MDSLEGNTTVLLVDDDTSLLQLYEFTLQDRFDVRTASSGEEGLARADDAVDVVLLDRRMPGMCGDDALRTLRERGFGGSVGMISAVPPDVDIIDLPCDEYITKPVDREELQTTVEQLAARNSLEDSHRELLQLVTKRAALQSQDRTLTASAEYQQLIRRTLTVGQNGGPTSKRPSRARRGWYHEIGFSPGYTPGHCSLFQRLIFKESIS